MNEEVGEIQFVKWCYSVIANLTTTKEAKSNIELLFPAVPLTQKLFLSLHYPLVCPWA